MTAIALIPARSGSKRLPNKNIKKLDGKPLMAYTIKAALESKEFDHVICVTDSEKHAKIASKYGAMCHASGRIYQAIHLLISSGLNGF